MSRVLHPITWSWRMPDGTICYWSAPDLENLLKDHVPSPDAEPVRCRLVPVREYAAMRRAAKDPKP